MVNNDKYLGHAEVLGNTPVMPGVFQLKLYCPDIAVSARPGQFVMLNCGDGTFLRRPVSIAGADTTEGVIKLLIANIGRGTDWLSKKTAKEQLELIGPLGTGFSIDGSTQKLLLISGGMGIAPLNFLAHWVVASGKQVTLVAGARTGDLLYPTSHLPELDECILYTEDASAGTRGRVTECPENYIAQADQIFACGPIPMYRSLLSKGAIKHKPVQISLEVRMACGIGLCNGCTIMTNNGPKQVCHDGPVFDMSEICWDELIDL